MTQRGSGQKQTNLAIVLLTAGSVAYAAASLLMRMAGTAYIGTFSKAFIRNLVILLSAAITMHGQKIKPVIRRENYLWMLSRAVFGTASALCGYYAIDHLMLADATMLSRLGPMFTVTFSAVLLKEHTSLKQKLLLAVAVFGMLLVVKPTWNFSLLFPMLMGIAAAVSYGYTFTAVRLMQMKGEEGSVLVFWYAVLSTIFMLPFLWGDIFVFAWDCLLMVIFSGLISSVTQLFNTKAYGMAPARTLSVYEYTQLPAAAALGWLILGEKPSVLSWIGYFVIVTASILMFRFNEKSC